MLRLLYWKGILGILHAIRFALAFNLVGALLAACGGTAQLPPSAVMSEHVVPSTPKVSRALRFTWMALGAKASNLLYVSNQGSGSVYVYRWPDIKLVGQLSGFNDVAGECGDRRGDVFVVNEGDSDIVEYAHGGTNPLKTLRDPQEFPVDCSVDPTTGDLAVTNIEGFENRAGSLEIYPHSEGAPKRYVDSSISEDYFCGFDDKGNLFLDGLSDGDDFAFAELPRGGASLISVTLNQSVEFPGDVRWDGKHIAVGDQQTGTIYQFAISGSLGARAGSTLLSNATDTVGFWIAGRKLIGANAAGNVLIWSYPAGGAAKKTLSGQDTPVGAVISPI